MDSSQRSGGDGWSDVEQRFFETAPPDVPLQPAAPPTFDDLEAQLPERRRRRHPPRKRQFQEPRDRWSPARRVVARWLAVTLVVLSRVASASRHGAALAGRRSAVVVRQVAGQVGRRSVVLAREGGRRLAAASREGWSRLAEISRERWLPLVSGRAALRDLVSRVVRLALGPVIDELPAQRGTIVAAVATIAIVVGLAAGVLSAYVPHLTFLR